MAIKGIVLDLEGPCVNLEWLHFQIWCDLSAKYGLAMTWEELVANIPNAVGGGEIAMCRGIADLLGNNNLIPILTEEQERMHYEYLSSLDLIDLRLGLVEAIEEFRKLGFDIAMGSMTINEQSNIMIAKSGLDKLIDPKKIVLGRDVAKRKPHPDAYLETAKRMGVDPQKQLVFEDSPTGIKAGIAANSPVVTLPLYTTKEYLFDLIEAGATRIFLGWKEINVPLLVESVNNGGPT